MPITTDIVATYRRPRSVMRRHMAQVREPRALAFLMGACVMVFVSQLPVLSRRAHLEQLELNPLLGASLTAWLLVAPLLLYALAWLTQGLSHVLRRPVSGYGARVALFWSLLAASPLMLLNGLVGGLIGPGPGLTLVGFVWLVIFGWFWISGLLTAGEGRA